MSVCVYTQSFRIHEPLDPFIYLNVFKGIRVPHRLQRVASSTLMNSKLLCDINIKNKHYFFFCTLPGT